MLTELLNMITMNFSQQEQDKNLRFQESSKSQKSQKNLKSKSSLFEMIFQQQYEFKMMKMKLEMMKLEAQKLANQKKLTEKNLSF